MVRGGKQDRRKIVNAKWTIGIAVAALALFLGASSAKEKAKAKAVKLELDTSTAVVLDKDRNGMPAKTKLICTACYTDYSLGPVVDGIKKRKEMDWQDCSWASAEDESAHGIEIQLSKPMSNGRFQVTWAYDIYNEDNGRWWVSRNYCIQTKKKAGDPWKTVVQVKNNQSVIGSYPLPQEEYSFLRIYQLAGGGHAARPNIMWVGQIELAD